MIDTHAHLDGPEFAEDLDEVIRRAQDAGVEKIFMPCINAKDFPHLLSVCAERPTLLYPMLGLHPEDVNPKETDIEAQLNTLETYLQQHPQSNLIAIGEVGFDFYWDDNYKAEQIAAFERQVEWSLAYDLPLMIHARNAQAELVASLKQFDPKRLRGVFHCFTSDAESARQLLEFPNFMLGIGGVLTFKKSILPQTLATAVPLSRIVLETDAPYMAPVPNRGKRNESAFLVNVVAQLATIYQTTSETIDRQTTENALSIFTKAI